MKIQSCYLPIAWPSLRQCYALGLGLILGLWTPAVASAGGTVINCTQAALAAALNGGGPVTFACDGVIVLTNTISITQDTTIDGAGRGVTISGGGAVRMFNVSPGANVTLRRLILANGHGTNGGAIFNSGILRIADTLLQRNEAVGRAGTNGFSGERGGDAAGGAIFNAGTLQVSNSVFAANRALGGQGGSGSSLGGDGGNGADAGAAFGGAIFNAGTVQVATTEFRNNDVIGGSGGNGGAAARASNVREPVHNGGQAGQGAAAAGGAIFNNESNVLAVVGSLFVSNHVFGGAGGVGGPGNQGVQSRGGSGGAGGAGGFASGGALHDESGALGVTNSTFAANGVFGGSGGDGGNGANCTGGRGGGNAGGSGPGGDAAGGAVFGGGAATVNLSNDTLVENTSIRGRTGTNGVPGAGCVGGDDGLILNPGADGLSFGGGVHSAASPAATGFNIRNTILASNVLVGPSAGFFSGNCSGAALDAGNNISSDSSCQFFAGRDNPSFNNTDPKLGPLAANGGPTRTFALLAGSPAIDAGDNAACLAIDQRGTARPQGGSCDIGAFEFTFATVLTKPAGGLRLTFSAVPNTLSVLQSSSDLVHWEAQPSIMTATNGVVTFDVASDPNAARRFFRTVTP